VWFRDGHQQTAFVGVRTFMHSGIVDYDRHPYLSIACNHGCANTVHVPVSTCEDQELRDHASWDDRRVPTRGVSAS
jgi:hypothetical protein